MENWEFARNIYFYIYLLLLNFLLFIKITIKHELSMFLQKRTISFSFMITSSLQYMFNCMKFPINSIGLQLNAAIAIWNY